MLKRNFTRWCALSRQHSLHFCPQGARLCSSSSSSSPTALPLVVPYNTGATSRGLLRPTHVRYFIPIPPNVARLLITGGLILLNGFGVAYMRAAAKVQEEEVAAGGVPGSATRPPMTALEAIQILGIDKVNPAYTQLAAGEGASTALLPLTAPNEVEAARQNFEKMFANAVKADNLFLAGKLSAAYRLCVDVSWDMKTTEKEDEEKKETEAKKIE